MKTISVFLGLILLTALRPLHAASVVCKEAKGHDFGQHGSEFGSTRVDAPDGMTRVTFVISWQSKSASITISDERIGRNIEYRAAVIRENADRVDLVYADPDESWLYSVFLKDKLALISRHDTDVSSHPQNGAIARSFIATCTVSS